MPSKTGLILRIVAESQNCLKTGKLRRGVELSRDHPMEFRIATSSEECPRLLFQSGT